MFSKAAQGILDGQQHTFVCGLGLGSNSLVAVAATRGFVIHHIFIHWSLSKADDFISTY
uniref:Uncharacterized protein n=1 Tax=Rhizophora mucronata TaxID=61149 RepID=A0A2P2NPV9_RHIMU